MTDLVKHSKFLSLVLRHKPETVGITLDSSGWVRVDTLLKAMSKHGHKMTHDILMQVVAENDKKRFALSDDKTMIRASQGHSVEVDLKYESKTPPDQLYHGTVAEFLDSIFKIGLIKGSRHHVHLSADYDTAVKVGSRRGKPTILIVNTKDMYEDGFEFFQSENGVWLTDNVPAKYLSFS